MTWIGNAWESGQIPAAERARREAQQRTAEYQKELIKHAKQIRNVLKPQWIYPGAQQPAKEPLSEVSDADLILEMLARGYAVSLMPVEQHAEEVAK